MTETARRVARLSAPHARGRILAAALAGAGAALAAAALGVALAPSVWGVVTAWLLVAAAFALAGALARRVRRALAPAVVGPLVERASASRAGSIAGLVGPATGSEALRAAADARAALRVDAAAPAVGRALARGTRSGFLAGAAAAALGAALFLAAAPASGRAAAFWHPLRTIARARAPVRLTVDPGTARRGESVTATVSVPGAARATLWTRAPGEPWTAATVTLDSSGTARRALGPLTADLFVRATSGGRESPTLRVRVPPLAFVGAVTVTAHYPAYLARPDETLPVGGDTALVPDGTTLVTAGESSVPLAGARWTLGDFASPLTVRGTGFAGSFRPRRDGRYALEIAPADSAPVDGDPPVLQVRVVADSAPVVAFALPAGDTTMSPTLHQPIVVDAHDDHGLARVALLSWRRSQTGKIGDTTSQDLPLGGATDRAILQAELDATARGLLPGDTLRLQVVAWDGAPAPHEGRSASLALRLPTLAELRAVTRAAAQDLGAATDSVLGAARALGSETQDLAAERTRAETTPRPGGREPAGGEDPRTGAMPFEQSQRAAELARRQGELGERVRDLSHAVEDLAQAAHAAGVDDSAFQARLADVQRLLQRAVTPELEQRLRELQDALQRLDPEATRQALQQLAQAQQQLKDALQRTDQLFHRAAVEGELATLSADAEELRQRQAQWDSTQAPRADSEAAARERELAAGADSLASGITQAGRDLAAGDVLAPPLQAAGDARRAMGNAGDAAGRGDASQARRHGEEAERALSTLPQALKSRRDSLTGAWRQETLDHLDRAMSETADLARRQQQVADQLAQGTSGAATRSAQASVEEGAEAVGRQIQQAAGQNALVSPGLDGALALARRQMAAARQELEQPRPNTQNAAALAAQAVDALNATALGLAQARADVGGSQSGSGLAEVLAQLAKLAGEQQGLNGQAQGLLPMMGAGGSVSEQLRALAARQRALADRLERLRASGDAPGAGALADEAKELARRMEAGQLDRTTLARQQQLYHRLLDAGRTLTGDQPDDQHERIAPIAGDVNPLIPPALRPGATGAGPRIPYPDWDALRGLTPDQRQQVLEYFRRLNAPAGP